MRGGGPLRRHRAPHRLSLRGGGAVVVALPRCQEAALLAVCARVLFASEIRPQDVVDEEIGDPVRDLLQVPRRLQEGKDGSV